MRAGRGPVPGVLAWASVVVGVSLAAAPLVAQTAESGVGATGLSLETYRFGDADAVGVRSLSLLTIPFGARVPLVGRAELEARGAFARGAMTFSYGGEATISGLTDTELRVRVPLVAERATAQAIVVLPTGHATHATDEAAVAGAIAADLLPFHITNWGTGGGAGLGLTMVRPLGDWGVGMGATYLVSRGFEPLEATPFTYRPGNTLLVDVAADRRIGETGKATLRIGVQHFAKDAMDDLNLFRPGLRYQLMGTYAFAAGSRSTGIAYAGVLHRRNGASLAGLAVDVPSQDLIVAGGGMRMIVGRGVLQPQADLRLFRSDDGVGQGYVVGLGGSLEWPVGGAVFVPTLRARLGNVAERDDLKSGLTGFELGLGVRTGGGAQ